MCVISLCTRGALDTWSRGRSTAALGAMNSEPATVKPPHAFTARVLVPLFVIVSVCTVGIALYVGSTAIAVGLRGEWSGYCSHGGGGELMAYALNFGWPVVTLHLVLSLIVVRTIRRSIVVTATSVLPVVVLVGIAPCF
jgi:hypothetical protein